MSLEPGRSLGPYRILERIGAGGMGEVYRARDLGLERDVAIKVLPDAVAADPERLARFEREAKALGALSHPNLLAIHGFARDGDTFYAVTELLEGETLGERLSHGPLPPRRAVEIAAQVAEGLAAAHEKGIVHRDVKPDNLFVTADGRVKILDFGLAKTDARAASVPPGQATRTSTEAGIVLGTAGYMSPEQVKGQPVDARSDVFSLGVVLHEMLTGHRLFHRDSAAETMSAILREDPPDLTASGRGITPSLDRVVQHCLEKSPAERFQSARDVAFALRAALDPTTGASPVAPTISRRARTWLLAGAACVAVGVAAFLAGRGLSRPQGTPGWSFQPLTYQSLTIFRALIAPDGSTVVFSASPQRTVPEVFTVTEGTAEPRALGLVNTHLLGVSRKGELAVLVRPSYINHRVFVGTLARVPMTGGAPRELIESVRDASWHPDAERLAILRMEGSIDRIEFPPGKVLGETNGYFSDLQFSPDGERIAFLDHPIKFDNRGGVGMVDLQGKRTTLAPGPYWGEEGLAWSRDGKEVLFSAGAGTDKFEILGASLDGTVRTVFGAPGGVIVHDVDANGRLLLTRDRVSVRLFVSVEGQPERELTWLDYSVSPAISPDGTKVVFSEQGGALNGAYAVVLRSLDASPVVRLGEGAGPTFSPDGHTVYAIDADRPLLYAYPVGPGEARTIELETLSFVASVTPFADGRHGLVIGAAPGRGVRVHEVDLQSGELRAVSEDGAFRDAIPDKEGRRFLSSVGPSGYSLFSMGGGAPVHVESTYASDIGTRWTPDEKGFVVLSGHDRELHVDRVDVATGKRTSFRVVRPAELTGAINLSGVDATPDGRVVTYAIKYWLSQLYLGTPKQEK
jgi:serine/threonine protein kinase/Tol biopolymer transport system component